MTKVVGVRFKDTGKTYYFDPKGLEIKKGDLVVVETARGMECGVAQYAPKEVAENEVTAPLKPVLRIATARDKQILEENKEKEKRAYEVCLQKIEKHKLDMNLTEVEYAFDGSKILFYFTADGRVDFRELVKDLASTFHTRIELRQIGVRDEAKMLGGLGICGRPFCCASYMDEFVPVSIKMAKTQNLSLNPTKISGTCGRLMCCLKYEQDAYEDAIKRMPKAESFVVTPDGPGNVSDINVLKETVNVRLDERPDAPRCYHNCEVCVLRNGKGSREGIAVPKERPERYVEPVAAEEMLIPNLFADYGTDTSADGDAAEARPSRRRSRGGRRRGGSGKAAAPAETAAPQQVEPKKEKPTNKPAKPQPPVPTSEKDAEAPRREGEGGQRRRRSRGRGGRGNAPSGKPAAEPNNAPAPKSAPARESAPRQGGEGGQRRPRRRGGRRHGGGKIGGTPGSEA